MFSFKKYKIYAPKNIEAHHSEIISDMTAILEVLLDAVRFQNIF